MRTEENVKEKRENKRMGRRGENRRECEGEKRKEENVKER
jgi:hypothetical protein